MNFILPSYVILILEKGKEKKKVTIDDFLTHINPHEFVTNDIMKSIKLIQDKYCQEVKSK